MDKLRSSLYFHLLCTFSSHEQVSTMKAQELLNAMTQHTLNYQEISWRISQYKNSALRSAVSRMRHEGLLSTELRKGKTYIRLTSAGREVGLEIFPGLNPIRPRWDKIWRVLIFSHLQQYAVPAETYRTLRTLIQRYNFAKLERGVYISPYPIEAELKRALTDARVFGACVVLETKRFVFGDEQQFAAQAWNLEEKSKSYAKIGKSIDGLLTRLNRENILNESHKMQFMAIASKLYHLFQIDQALPEELFSLEKGYNSPRTQFFALCALIAGKDSTRISSSK